MNNNITTHGKKTNVHIGNNNNIRDVNNIKEKNTYNITIKQILTIGGIAGFISGILASIVANLICK